MKRKQFVILAVLSLLLSLILKPGFATPSDTVEVQILAINDFHGNLEPPAGSSGQIQTTNGSIDAGGAEYLATHINRLRERNPHTVVVSAGDLIGASPLLSALFHDEPTIEAFNVMGLDFNAVGNHEFDEGAAELLRMQKGGCHPTDACLDGDDFEGANFRFLAANVVQERDGKPFFPAYKTRRFAGVKIAFIGMTLQGTPAIVSPSGVAGLQFLDEADTVNALIPELKAKGIETIVVLIHEGGMPIGGYNECPDISGSIVDIVNRTDDEVDLFITGHTHQAYNCVIDGRVVTSAAAFGRLITDIDLTLDRATGEATMIRANNVIVTHEVEREPVLTNLIAKYNAVVAPLANRVIGSVTVDITRSVTPSGESALGDVIADAQLAATADPALGGAVVAFMNPGGIRADITFSSSGAGEGDGHVTYGEAFTVQPFGNSLVTMTLTGAQIKQLLEQQFNNPAPGQNRILQVSDGFTYTWSQRTLGTEVSNIQIQGSPINPDSSYRVTVNSFLADGGDNFSVLTLGTDDLGGALDLDALEDYFRTNSPIAPGASNRITRIP